MVFNLIAEFHRCQNFIDHLNRIIGIHSSLIEDQVRVLTFGEFGKDFSDHSKVMDLSLFSDLKLSVLFLVEGGPPI